MEIPFDLKKLYSHWQKHTERITSAKTDLSIIDQQVLSKVVTFAAERMLIWHNKMQNKPQPYTLDPILANYRFCNIYRELDRQTIQIHEDLLSLKSELDLRLLNLCFHRFVCRPETVIKVGHLSFDDAQNIQIMNNLLNLERPKYGTAYVFPISVLQNSDYNSREKFFCLYLPNIIPQIAALINPFKNETVKSALNKILPVFGYNFRFHWTEILIDIAYQFPEKINLSKDFHIGPGAMPTLQKLGKTDDLNLVLNALANNVLLEFPYLKFNDRPVFLSAENWEGIACEYRKYSNLLTGNGRKKKYL